MLDQRDERSLKAAAAALALSLIAASAGATDPRALQGRWAVDPVDCVENRYVWVFTADRAGLFVDNGAVSGWRRASYSLIADGVVGVAIDGVPRREFRWRISGRDEIATAGIVENGRMVEERSFQVWRRCTG